MEQNDNQLTWGLRLSLNLLVLIAIPFITLGVMGAVLLAAFSVVTRDLDDYGRYFIFLGIVLLFFVTGRSLMLFAEFIRRSHTQDLTENLQVKFGLLVIKEVTFIIAYVLSVATLVNVVAILMGFDRDHIMFLPFYTLTAIFAGFINRKICDKMKSLETDPLVY